RCVVHQDRGPRAQGLATQRIEGLGRVLGDIEARDDDGHDGFGIGCHGGDGTAADPVAIASGHRAPAQCASTAATEAATESATASSGSRRSCENVKRTAVCATSGATPIATSTCDGSSLPAAHADPL